MAQMSILNSILNGFNILGRGKDLYTQTRFTQQTQWKSFLKGTEWELCDTNKQKFNLYNTTAHLKCVIDRKALMKANGRYKEMRIGSNGEPEEVENSEIVQLIENPNFLQSGNDYAALKSINYSVFGNSIEFFNSVSGRRRAMWNLPIDEMTFERTGKSPYKQVDVKGVIEYYERQNVDGTTERFEVENILHLREPNPNDPLVGLSKIPGLLMKLSNMRGAEGFDNRIINSNAMLGILSSEVSGANQMDPRPLDTDAQKKISQGLGMRFGMQEGKQDILQTEANVKWQSMSYPKKDLLLFETITEGHKLIIDTFGLNMNIFSLTNQTYENMEHGIRLAYRDTIIPEAENEALAYTKMFGLDGKTRWLEQCFEHLDILKTDESEILLRKSQSIEILLRSGVSAESVSEITGIELGKVKVIEAKAVVS